MPLEASLHITTGVLWGRTVLLKSYCTQPFKVADVSEDRSGKPLRLMLMSSSPGILDGDSYNIQFNIGPGTEVVMHTQAYQRLFQMKKGAAQSLEVRLGEGSCLTYLPHPVVPHREAVFVSRTRIHLSSGCRLLWGEVISCGRKLNGEVFQFTSLQAITELYLGTKLLVKENLLLQPALMDLPGIGHLEGYSHQATLLVTDEELPVPETINALSAFFAQADGITCGITALPVNGLLVRLLGHKAEQLFSLLQGAAALLAAAAIRQPSKEIYVG
jgi:urease accessory protein